MKKKAKDIRQDVRVAVDLPITLFADGGGIQAEGKVDDISINGMKVHVPLPSGMVEDHRFDFHLNLPDPFSKIKGQGQVQWKRWNQAKGCVTCGLKLEPMTLRQLTDLGMMIEEIAESDK